MSNDEKPLPLNTGKGKSPGRVTLVELAQRLGLSKSTVSEALRGRGRISQETRQRVKQAAQELVLRPDPIMSAFSRHRRKKGGWEGTTLAVVHSRKLSGGPNTEALQEFAETLGYRVEGFGLVEYPSQQALGRVLEARGIAGVLFAEGPSPISLSPGVWARFRCVYCGPYPGGGDEACPVDIVRHNPFDALCLAWRKCVEAGYQRIGLVFPTQEPQMSVLEEKAVAAYLFRQRSQKPALPVLEPLCPYLPVFRDQPEVMAEWFNQEQPEVVIGGYEGVFSNLSATLGYRIPEDFAFAALRVQPSRDLAGCRLQRQVVARVALQHLHALIQHSEEVAMDHSTTLVVNPSWQNGSSLPAPVRKR